MDMAEIPEVQSGVPATFDKKRFVRCKKYPDFLAMRQKEDIGRCVYCVTSFPPKVKLLYEDPHVRAWRVSRDHLPQEIEDRFLVVPRKHVLHEELETPIVVSMFRAEQEVRRVAPGGTIVANFGDMDLHSGLTDHFHRVIIVPSRRGSLHVPVYQEATEEDLERVTRFNEQYESEQQSDSIF